MKTLFSLIFTYCMGFLITTVDANTQNKKSTVPPPDFEKTLYTNTFVLQKIPTNSFEELINESIKNRDFTVGGEVLHSFDVKDNTLYTEDELDTKILEVLFNVESLIGIEYYSNSRQRYREFILESYAVDDNKNKEKVLNPVVHTEVLNKNVKKHSFLTYQKDSSFGSGVREVSIYHNAETHEVYMQIVNLEKVKYKGFIPIAKPRSLLLSVLIQREGDKYREYMFVATETKSPLTSIREKASKSLVYRMYAMGKWFEEEIKKVL